MIDRTNIYYRLEYNHINDGNNWGVYLSSNDLIRIENILAKQNNVNYKYRIVEVTETITETFKVVGYRSRDD